MVVSRSMRVTTIVNLPRKSSVKCELDRGGGVWLRVWSGVWSGGGGEVLQRLLIRSESKEKPSTTYGTPGESAKTPGSKADDEVPVR